MQGTIRNIPPPPTGKRIAVRVTPAAENAIRRGHPWLFADAITRQSQKGQPGDLAVIFDRNNKFIAIGLYDPTSSIRVRILQHHQQVLIDQQWFAQKLSDAIQIRAKIPGNTNAFRLVHGENDHLPGLVVDRYAQSVVLKLYSLAWIPYLVTLIPILNNLLNPEIIVLRLNRKMHLFPEFLFQFDDGSALQGTLSNNSIMFIENGITFEADIQNGQKTGFFLDQRDNRARVEKLSKDKRVLNMFSYTGGFSVYAARGGAQKVVSADISKLALEAAQRNFSHNRSNPAIAACQHEVHAGDAFELLRNYANNKMIFDMLILDPPSFAKRKSEIKQAISAYHRLTSLGLKVLSPGGILVQASCSSRVSPSVFFETIHQAAQQNGRRLQEIERTGHTIDHPIQFPDGEYLKCLFAVA
jgi:23S rRNA (cytosine1962-C5)-methyltransferase